jgi:hypothetical protein
MGAASTLWLRRMASASLDIGRLTSGSYSQRNGGTKSKQANEQAKNKQANEQTN